MNDRKLPWFRLYSEIISHPRVEMLSFEDQRHYVWLLCLKNEGLLDDAKMPSPDFRERSIAKKLGLDIERLRDMRVRLMDMALIDAGYQPIGWDERQFCSDSSRERVARYRERQKQKASENRDNRDETEVKRDCNVTGNVAVTIQETDTDTDTDTDTSVAGREGGVGGEIPAPEKLKQARGARLSLSDLPPDWKTWAMQERPDLDPERTWALFTDYWKAQPGQKGVKTDWCATWRNWVRRESRNNGGNGNAAHRQSCGDKTERRAAINRELIERAKRHFPEVD